MILTCLDGDEDGREAVDAAERMAAVLGLRVAVVRVLTGAGTGPCASVSTTDWILRTDSPAAPLVGFARRNRVRQVVLGPRAWARWGESFRREGLG